MLKELENFKDWRLVCCYAWLAALITIMIFGGV